MKKDGKEIHKIREESIEIYADDTGKEYLICPKCGRPYDAFLVTTNTPFSVGGINPKTKCRDCSIKVDGMGYVAKEVGKILGDAVRSM